LLRCAQAGGIRVFGSLSYTLDRYGSSRHSDPAPLSLRQMGVLASAAGRALTWIWPTVSRELKRWNEYASRIPDERLREDALRSIALKRENAQGAALFCILPKARQPRLLTLLVAYQTLWDFLDNVSERGAFVGSENGYWLHSALVDALDPYSPTSDYYRHHPWSDDGGYLLELVSTCRSCCLALPSYSHVRSLVLDGVRQCAIQGINHLPNHRQRERELKAWVEQAGAERHRLQWFELAAAASAFLPHALLALASEPSCDASCAMQVQAAYFPWMALAIAMLDSYVDTVEDQLSGNHSYISHYPSQRVMSHRLREILTLTMREVASLPNGTRHVLMAAAMMAMYLSTATCSELTLTKEIAAGGGSFTRLLVPAARQWRAFDLRVARSASSIVRRSARLHALPPQMPLPAAVQTFLFWRSPFQFLQFCRRRYGSGFTLAATSQPPLIFLSEPEEIRSLMGVSEKTLRAGEGGRAVSPIVGERSFMLSDGPEHRIGRRTVLAAFHTRAVQRHTDAIVAAGEQALASWPTNKQLALHPRLRSLTLEIILRTLTGRFAGPLDHFTLTLRDRILEMLKVTASPVFIEPQLRRGLGRRTWQRFLHSRAQVDQLLAELIDERTERGGSSEDLLGELAALSNPEGSPMSRDQVRDNAMSLILAGHETTAAQLSWAFHLLAHNPSVCGRLYEEIDRGVSEEYLTATIHEVLRHRCVFVFAIPRAVAGRVEIGGRTYQAPAHMLACIYLLHHDPTIYPSPNAFRPERFLGTPPDPHTWMPWGGGHKRCPGLHLAMLEMKTILRTVLAERTIHPASRNLEHPRWRSVIVTPHAGGRVILRARHH
jgi:cytochrome P450